MRGKPTYQSKQFFGKQDNYEVWGFYKCNYYPFGKKTSYIIMGDDFGFHTIDENVFHMTDDNINGYEFMTKYSNENLQLYLKPELNILIQNSLTKDWDFTRGWNIWDRTWLAKLLKERGDKISAELNGALENENDKVLLIDGFLDFANDYINYNKDSDLTYHLIFSKEQVDTSPITSALIVETGRPKVTVIEKNSIEDKLQSFIHSALFGEQKIIVCGRFNASEETARRLFLTIDSIFVNGIESAYFIEDDWDDKFVMRYNNYYYILEHGFSD